MKKPIYPKEPDTFFATLRDRVNLHFSERQIDTYGNARLIRKIMLLTVAYLGLYALVFVAPVWSLPLVFALIGVTGVILGLNAGHDAAHHAIFKNRKANDRLMIVFDLLGTNSYNWRNRHIYAHHPFPNVSNQDSDIQQSKIVRIFPEDEHQKFHKWQAFYMPFLYLIYILRWVIYRDFADFRADSIGAFKSKNIPPSEMLKLMLYKVFYFGYVVVVPIMALEVSIWLILLCFLILTVSGSLFITLVLLCAHVGKDSKFPAPDANGVMPYSWSHHQLMVTTDFATGSKLANYLFGGFNHHTIHHLFPNICHIHYEELTPILKQTAAEFGIQYNSQKYLWQAIASHFQLLKIRGHQLDLAGLELD